MNRGRAPACRGSGRKRKWRKAGRFSDDIRGIQADGHALIISKESAETLHNLSPEGAAACIQTTQKIAKAIEAALDVPGTLVMQLNGKGAGQTVPHVHFHVIPTSIAQLRATPHATNPEKPERLEEFARKIREYL